MKEQNTRRNFITTVLGGAAAIGLSAIPSSLTAGEINPDLKTQAAEAEKWFSKMRGKHKMVFDMVKHNNGAALSWALTLMDSYNDMGVTDKDLSLVIILRYAGTPLSIADSLWAKYGLGKRIELKDPETKEFSLRNIEVRSMVPIPLIYKGYPLNKDYVIDLLVEEEIIIELKAVEGLLPVHEAQIISYLKLADKRLGFLINFNVPLLKNGFKRFVNNF